MSSRAPLSVISSSESGTDDPLALDEDAETQQDFQEFTQFLDSLESARGSEEGSDVKTSADAPSSRPPSVAKTDHPSSISPSGPGPSAPNTSATKQCSKCYGTTECSQPALEE